MLKNNGKIIIGGNFLFCLCVICLMLTSIGFCAENSYAVDLNETIGNIVMETGNVEKLENSHDEHLQVDSQNSPDSFNNSLKAGEKTYATIKSAIDSASSGDTVKLSGNYYSTGNGITVNKKLTITGDGNTVLDGKSLSRAFYINVNGAGTVFKNIKFINGNDYTGSAVLVGAKNVKFENCIFEDNHALKGGALCTLYDLDTVSGTIIENCQFRRNFAYQDNSQEAANGAALAVYGKNSEIKNCLFEDNWVKSKVDSYGGAIQVGMDEPGSNVKVINCRFINNRAISINGNTHGGAGCVRQGTSYINCVFIANSADQGGALTFHSSGAIVNCTFINNTANEYGGALSTGFLYDYMELHINNCNFDGNTAPIGGAIQAKGLNIIIEDSDFKNNAVTKYGGAINIEADDVTIKNSVFTQNKANINGGAVYIKGKNTDVEGSSFISNEAIPDFNKKDDGLGGAIYIDSSLAFVKDNVFRLNVARNGSAIYYDENAEKLTLENNELFHNQAWVYWLPISSENIYYGNSEEIKVTLYGGNNIADYDNLAVSNAIYNAADVTNIIVDNEFPLMSARNDGKLYQDSREYNVNVQLTVKHEDGTVVYNQMRQTNYLGDVNLTLTNLKPGKYYVSATHDEDTYYKAISNSSSFTVSPLVDNEVTKSVSKQTANYEDVITWTVTVKNNGPNDSTDVKLYDMVPEGLILINFTSNDKYNPESGTLTIGTLKVNETFTFKMTTIINKTGNIVNKANVVSFEDDSNMNNNYDEKTVFVKSASDLAITKKVSNQAPNYKDKIEWTIEISNNGPDTAHNVKMYDVIPESLIYVGCDGDYSPDSGIWNIGTLEAGKKATLKITCIVNSTGLIENFASVNGSEFDYDETNNNDSEKIFVNPASDLDIKKEVNATNVNFNDKVKWTLTVSNNGPDKAVNIEILDLLPDGFTYISSTLSKGSYDGNIFTVDSMEVNEKVIIQIITLAESTGNLINYANVTSDNYDTDLTNNEDEKPILVNPASDLSVTKTVSDSNPEFGDVITWTIEIINNGPDAAHNITAQDLLPDSLIWLSDDSSGDYNPLTGILFIEELDVEETYVLNIECRVNATGLIENNVTVNGQEYDYNITNNFANETVDVEKSADVSVIKIVNNTSPFYNDLVKWTLIISNKGPDKATNVYVEDQLPEGLILENYTATKGIYDNGIWSMCCLNNGDSETLEIICRVKKTGKIINVAEIHADEYDSNETNNDDNETITVPFAVDLQVSIHVNNATPLFGQDVTWMVCVKNNGPDNATGVVLDDILPEALLFNTHSLTKGSYTSNLWTIGSLNSGDAVYLNLSTISNDLGNIINKVQVTSNEYDWNMANNYDDDLIDVKPVADLSIEKLVDNPSPDYGEMIKWTLIVTNHGPNTANNIVVRDVLPKGMTFVKSDSDYSGNVWKIESLDVDETRVLEIFCKITSTGSFNNFASVSSDEFDSDKSNNNANQSIYVRPASDLVVTKIASKHTYKVGDVIEYVIEIVNNGPDTARNIKVNEILDDLLKLKSFKSTKGKFNKFTNVWTIDSLACGQSAKLFIKVIATGSGIIKNTVEVTTDTFDYDTSNNKDFAIVKVGKKPSDNIQKPLKSNLNGKTLSNLEKHPTANPFWMLIVSLLFSLIFFRSSYFKGKLN